MKTIIDQITQPNGSILVVYSDGTTEVKKKSDLELILREIKTKGINKR